MRISNNKAEIVEDLQVALSLARGNLPAKKPGARLEKIAVHVERALRKLSEKQAPDVSPQLLQALKRIERAFWKQFANPIDEIKSITRAAIAKAEGRAK